ncbi:MAG: hypothetical protein M3R61_00380, partial [Chloroflexota bacterium]|nr:hypothetical protein [Chloroflexota bacterium]
MPESSELAANLASPPADPPVRQAARVPGLTPTITARRDVVTVLVRAPFDTWYDQWMLQADGAADPAGVDYFDDAVRLLEPAALGMAAVALRTHLDAHHVHYVAAGVSLLIEPLVPQEDEIVQLLGV